MASIGNSRNREIEIIGTARYPGLRFKQQPKKNRSTELDDVLNEYEDQAPKEKLDYAWIMNVLLLAAICLLLYVNKKQRHIIQEQQQWINTIDSLIQRKIP